MSELALLFGSDQLSLRVWWAAVFGAWIGRVKECLVCGAPGRKSRILYVLYVCALPGLATSVRCRWHSNPTRSHSNEELLECEGALCAGEI